MAKRVIRYFNGAERKILLDSIKESFSPHKQRDFFMLNLMFHTGLRVSELVSLKCGDVIGRDWLLVRNGKGNREGDVPLSPEIKKDFEVFLNWKKVKGEGVKPNDPLFISRNRRRMHTDTIRWNLNKWVERAGLKERFSPHAFRHSAITEYNLKNGGDIRATQIFARHKSISSTMRYVHPPKELIQRYATKLWTEENKLPELLTV